MSQKSGILEWNETNIESSPVTPGIFVLTNSPTNGTAVDLRAVVSIRDSLTALHENFLSDTSTADHVPRFFYWYSTNTIEEAEERVDRLRNLYGL